MNAVKLLNLPALQLLWLVLPICALFIYASYQRKKLLQRFVADMILAKNKSPVSKSRRTFKQVLVVLAFMMVVLALARPAWNKKEIVVKRQGRDVVFMLDVSRSMLADDLLPNRLEHAKLAILDTVDLLQGDRVALVVFAGKAIVRCPLTLDYGFFRMMLDDVSVDSAPVGDRIGLALAAPISAQQRSHRSLQPGARAPAINAGAVH